MVQSHSECSQVKSKLTWAHRLVISNLGSHDEFVVLSTRKNLKFIKMGEKCDRNLFLFGFLFETETPDINHMYDIF